MADPDDILSSLGGSLMQDLLKDLSLTTAAATTNSHHEMYGNDDENEEDHPAMLSTLAMLERELDFPSSTSPELLLPNNSNNSTTATTAASWIIPPSSQPPPLPAAFAASSPPAAAVVTNPSIITSSSSNSQGGGGMMDAWALSLNKFSTLNLEHDFIQADLDKKNAAATTTTKQPPLMFEDYDVSASIPAPPPGIMTSPPPPSSKRPPPGVIPPPPGVVIPPSTTTPLATLSSPQQHTTGAAGAGAATVLMASPTPTTAGPPPPPPGAAALMMNSPPPGVVPMGPPGVTAAARMPLGMAMAIPPPPQQPKPSKPSNLFDNPDPKAPPVQAKSTSCMTSKDILTVVHASLRPLYAMMHTTHNQTHAASLSHHADFYHLQYTMSTPPIVHPTTDPATNTTTTTADTVEREQIALREKNFVVTTEKRATEWSQKQQTLGQVVKTNVYRPRALLSSTTVLRKQQPEEEEKNHHHNQQRTNLWKARLLTDRGYNAMLELMDLRNILFTNNSNSNNNNTEEQQLIRQQYLPHVQRHIHTLYKTFGVEPNNTNNNNNNNNKVNPVILSLTLSLPKGRVLLARLFHMGIFPHDSARLLLPHLCQIVFAATPNNASSNIMENQNYDRLIQAMVGLIRTVHPSVHREELLDCLQRILHLQQQQQQQPNILVTSSRAHMELLHSILTRCQQICSPQDMEWKNMERIIFTKLSSPQPTSS